MNDLTPRTEEERYNYWRDVAGQNSERMARQLAINPSTVGQWVSRGRWRARAASDDLRDFGDTVSYLRRRERIRAIRSSEVLDRAVESVYGEDGRPIEGTPTPIAVKEAEANLARLGISPKTVIQHEYRESSEVAGRAVEAILNSRDEDALLHFLQTGEAPPEYAVLEAEVVDITDP